MIKILFACGLYRQSDEGPLVKEYGQIYGIIPAPQERELFVLSVPWAHEAFFIP